MTNQEIERHHRRLVLRVGVERYCTYNWRYLSQVKLNFTWASPEELETVIKEMLLEGLLIQTVGRSSAVKLRVNNGQTFTEEENNG